MQKYEVQVEAVTSTPEGSMSVDYKVFRIKRWGILRFKRRVKSGNLFVYHEDFAPPAVSSRKEQILERLAAQVHMQIKNLIMETELKEEDPLVLYSGAK